MAKRFSDSDKWKKPFLRSLQAPYKLFWLYLLDDCDHAGIWHVDIEIAEIKIGEKIDKEIALKQFNGKINEINNGEKWFIKDFIEFQYGTLNPANRVHESVINILKKQNLINENMELISPLQGAKDKDKDKLKVKEKDKDKDSAKKQNLLFKDSEYYILENLEKGLSESKPPYTEANAEYYHNSMENWSDSKNEKKMDWLATCKNWILRDFKEGKLVDKNYKIPTNGKSNNGLTEIQKRRAELEQELANKT